MPLLPIVWRTTLACLGVSALNVVLVMDGPIWQRVVIALVGVAVIAPVMSVLVWLLYRRYG